MPRGRKVSHVTTPAIPVIHRDPPLVRFYMGISSDDEGRKIDDMLTWDNQLMQVCHDYIQWLFPTDEPSRFNKDAPLLNASIADLFKSDSRLQLNVRRALKHFSSFLGLAWEGSPESQLASCTQADNFEKRILGCWQGPNNHNWKRITRILRCLQLVGMIKERDAFYACLLDIIATHPCMVDGETVRFWQDAAGKTCNSDQPESVSPSKACSEGEASPFMRQGSINDTGGKTSCVEGERPTSQYRACQSVRGCTSEFRFCADEQVHNIKQSDRHASMVAKDKGLNSHARQPVLSTVCMQASHIRSRRMKWQRISTATVTRTTSMPI